ncbi:MAG: adenylosuccinate synthase [Bacteroidetes bacterium]|nr:MAG: adenylosuccinate synthase [Bacteroidota bacterium]
MNTDVLLGLQWGDEGKGKIVDYLAPYYDVIARFQGGPNAGHSLEFGNEKHVLHTIPSGIFHPGKTNVIGNGVVIDPIIFEQEIQGLKKGGLSSTQNLLISKKAHIILPTHRLLDAASEAAKGKTKIGSTLKGIGPTYMDKTGRNGLRVGDILLSDFKERYEFLKKKHLSLISLYDYSIDNSFKITEEKWFKSIEFLKQFKQINSEYLINQYMDEGKKVLAEGAQGTLLDIDFGSYPFVTSSNTLSAGACIGLGISPTKIGKVHGIFKAYCTRVGSGPFPTELEDKTGEKLRKNGHEFGATTGRPRRCGWMDLVALKYAIMLNGVSNLIMTKSDVLTGFEKIKICTSYKNDGESKEYFPFQITPELEPVYKEFPGWEENITHIDNYDDLPVTLKQYIQFIEEEVEVPISIISVGPDRQQTIFRGNK